MYGLYGRTNVMRASTTGDALPSLSPVLRQARLDEGVLLLTLRLLFRKLGEASSVITQDPLFFDSAIGLGATEAVVAD
jgi:hypothetical protein